MPLQAKIHAISVTVAGRLSIVARPRGADWLEDEIDALRRAGVNVLVSALTRAEEDELGLLDECDVCRRLGVGHIGLPINDRDVPSTTEPAGSVIRALALKIESGASIAVHCRQGIGRSGLITAAILCVLGSSPADAFARVEEARGRPVPDTQAQIDWVARFATSLSIPSSDQG